MSFQLHTEGIVTTVTYSASTSLFTINGVAVPIKTRESLSPAAAEYFEEVMEGKEQEYEDRALIEASYIHIGTLDEDDGYNRIMDNVALIDIFNEALFRLRSGKSVPNVEFDGKYAVCQGRKVKLPVTSKQFNQEEGFVGRVLG